MNLLVEDFGAKAHAEFDSTQAIQAALDHCSSSGGGRVVLSQGTYLSATLQLKSDVDLHIETGSVLRGLPDQRVYPEVPCMLVRDGCSETTEPEQKGYAFLYSYRARNIRLSGGGTIDGGGERFRNQPIRPFLLRIIESSAVTLEGLTFTQSACWCCHVLRSEDVTIRNLTIRSANIRNGDGIDIDSSSDVTISDCDIRTNDDAICLKTTSMTPCQNIRVTDCVLESDCSAIKIGTESLGDFSDIQVSRCAIGKSGVVAIKVTAVDGGSVENVLFSDLTIQDSTGPIFVATGNRGRSYLDEADPERRSTIRNVTFRRMEIGTARYERRDKGVVMHDRGQGIVVSGRPGQLVSDITFEDLNVSFWGGVPTCDVRTEDVPVLTDEYPECHKLGILPSYGYYFQYAENVTVERCTTVLLHPDVRPVRVDGPGTTSLNEQ